MISSGGIDIDAYEVSEVHRAAIDADKTSELRCAATDAKDSSIAIIPTAYSVRPLTL